MTHKGRRRHAFLGGVLAAGIALAGAAAGLVVSLQDRGHEARAAAGQASPSEAARPAAAAGGRVDWEKEKKARLVPAAAGVEAARRFPRNPLTDPGLNDPEVAKKAKAGDRKAKAAFERAEAIKLGFRIFMDTPKYAPQFSGNSLSCTSCHLVGGQKEGALPLVGVTTMFPEYNARAGRMFSIEDRIMGCFLRSMNGANSKARGARHENDPQETAPSNRSKEVLAVAAYLTWLSEGLPVGEKPPWRGLNQIAEKDRIPIEKLDPNRGEALYGQKCAFCHGADGQGLEVAPGVRPGPLWGSRSWNDGAGAARVYTLAGYLKYAMPYSAPGSLTSGEAQQIAAYLTAQARPVFPGKAKDYLAGKVPKEAVYYPKLYKVNPMAAKMGAKLVNR